VQVRRVVTGSTPSGAAVVIDDHVDPITVGLAPGIQWHRIWGSDAPAALPAPGSNPEGPTVFPPPGGFRFGFLTMGPGDAALPADFDLDAGIREMGEKLPGMMDVVEPEHPGMHTSNTVDYIIVLSGEVCLELDNEERVVVRAGEAVVQNGTRHAWHNLSDEPCVMATAIVGATRRT
jgi:mannose-6-phosphate isomerase-like protein (cupin superfamily)